MTEQEWLKCTDPEPLLAFVEKKRNRKLRLAAVASCRLFTHEENDARLLKALDVAELFADERATQAELQAAEADANAVVKLLSDEQAAAIESPTEREEDALTMAWAIRQAAAEGYHRIFDLTCPPPGTEFLVANVVREVFGPPTAVSFNRAWLTSNNSAVRRIAQAIYDERAFDRMPILADALEDAGCDSTDILKHCRGDGPHVRGCWVLDVLLGKE